MKLYTFDPAPNPRRVKLFLTYKGIDLPTVQIDLRQGAQFSKEFRAINPRCIVPALQLDDGSVLCDAIAICWYLEKLYPQKPLMGTEPLQQAQILSWDQRIYSDGFYAVADVHRPRGSWAA
jgi:glutathione S-transferase